MANNVPIRYNVRVNTFIKYKSRNRINYSRRRSRRKRTRKRRIGRI
jgi:hypothetical protein